MVYVTPFPLTSGSLPACFSLILFISNNKKSGSQDWNNIPVASPEVTRVLCIFLFYHP